MRAFWALVGALTVSASYQYYRSRLGKVPALDVYGKQEIASYLIAVGISASSLANRKWSDVLILLYCFVLYLVVFGYYFPQVHPRRTNGFWDVTEAVVYMALILLAASFAWRSLKKRPASPQAVARVV